MARYGIYHKGSTTPFCYADSLDFTDKWMGECVVTADVSSAVPVEFAIGDYIDYLGERFSIYYETSVMKQARRESYGGAFKYSGVKFYNCAVELKHCRFKDTIEYDGNYYAAGTEFSLHCDTVETLVERIVENLNRNIIPKKKPGDAGYDPNEEYEEKEPWTYEIERDVESATHVDLKFANISCWEALQMVATKFKTGAYVKGRKIIVGSCISNENKALKYGKGNGLVSIERAYVNDDEIITRLRAYGNTKNMPTNYYSDIFEPILELEFVPEIGGIDVVDDKDFVDVWAEDQLNWRVVETYPYGKEDVAPLAHVLKDKNAYEDEIFLRIRIGIQLSSRQGNIYYGYRGSSNSVAYFIESKGRHSDFYIGAKLSDFFQYDASNKRGYTFKTPLPVLTISDGLPYTWIYSLKRYWKPSRPIAPVGLGINRLMLPDFMTYKGTSQHNLHLVTDAYIDDEKGIKKYGVREGSVFFDNEEIGDIYPTIQGMMAESVRAAGIDISIPEGDNGRMDEILWCDCPDDNGYISNTDEGEDTKKPNWFDIYLKDLGFDILSYLSTTESPKIKMMSGDCSGMEFDFMGGGGNVERVEMFYENYEEDGKPKRRFFREREEGDETQYKSCYAWRIRLKRFQSGELTISFPNNTVGNMITGELKQTFRPGDGTMGKWHTDQFVILNIEMPRLYIREAEQRLEVAAREYLKEHNHPKSQYNVKLDGVFMQRDVDVNGADSLRYNMRAGTRFLFEDADLDPNYDIDNEKWYIDSFNIKENGQKLPEYSVVLKQDVELSTIQKINSQIVTLNSTMNTMAANMENGSASVNRVVAMNTTIIAPGGNGGTSGGTVTAGVSEEDVTNIGDGRYARLHKANVFTDANTFEAEIHATDIVGDGFHTASDWNNEEAGASIYERDHEGFVDTDFLNVRRAAFFRTLTIAEVEHMGGEVILSAAACQIAEVLQSESKPEFIRCLFDGTSNGRKVYNEWKVGDLAYCKRWDNTNKILQDYWRMVVAVGNYSGDRYFVDLASDVDARYFATGSSIPEANDTIVLRGHIKQANEKNGEWEYRTCAQVYSTIGPDAPSRKYYNGIVGFYLPEPVEVLSFDGKAHWKVGGDTSNNASNYIQYKDDKLTIKADSILLESAGDLADAFKDRFEIWHSDDKAPVGANGQIRDRLLYSIFDVSKGWNTEELKAEHEGDYLITTDGVSYQFQGNGVGGYMWVLSSDRFLLNVMNFKSGLEQSPAFAKLFTKIEHSDGSVEYGDAGMFVETKKNEETGETELTTAFKVKAGLMTVETDNFTLDKDGVATLRGLVRKGHLTIDRNNNADYFEYQTFDLLRSNAGGYNYIELKYADQGDVILIPSFNSESTLTKEDLEGIREYIGQDVVIYNNSQSDVEVQGIFYEGFDHNEGGNLVTATRHSEINLPCGYMLCAHCMATMPPTTVRPSEDNVGELVWWQVTTRMIHRGSDE